MTAANHDCHELMDCEVLIKAQTVRIQGVNRLWHYCILMSGESSTCISDSSMPLRRQSTRNKAKSTINSFQVIAVTSILPVASEDTISWYSSALLSPCQFLRRRDNDSQFGDLFQ
jgi:hypothetical protein